MKKLWTLIVLLPFIIILVLVATGMAGGLANQCDMSAGEVWAHRGLHVHAAENSVDAAVGAADQGFPGIEVDVYYDGALGLVASHDSPYIPVDGRVVLLEEILKAGGPEMQFWIDLKNLRYANRKAVRRAFDDLVGSGAVTPDQLRIESAQGPALRSLARTYPCIFWVQYSRKPIRKTLKLAYLKTLIGHASFTGITTDERYIDPGFRKAFDGNCWYVFTVNDRNRMAELLEIPEVAVILTDLENDHLPEPAP